MVLAGHGSRSADANRSLRALAATLETRLGYRVVAAYLEMAEPSIPTTILGCVLGGAQHIVIVPYFLHPGMHVSRDIVEIVDAARSAHPRVTFTVAAFFGSHPRIGDVLADLTRDALAGQSRSEAV